MDLERSHPSPLPPIPFLNSPHRRNQNGNERQGERAVRAVLRAWRDSEGRHAIGAYFAGSSHHARGACEVRGSAGNGFGLFDTMTTFLNHDHQTN
ncbi:MAG: hypothetical protein AAB972_00730 [Patescibacteria group bacterium]